MEVCWQKEWAILVKRMGYSFGFCFLIRFSFSMNVLKLHEYWMLLEIMASVACDVAGLGVVDDGSLELQGRQGWHH